MRSARRLPRIFGVHLRLHYTWFVAFILITVIVLTQFPESYPLWQRIIFGIAASLLFGVAVGIRESILSITAIVKGIPVKRVTLFVFGGLAQVTHEATSPALERLLAVVGFLSNLVIAGIFYGVCLVLLDAGDIIFAGLLQWLAYMFFLLAIFHFIPGFPLDGGRLLRSFLWMVTGNYDRSTRIAGWAGRGFGLLFAVGGILLLVILQQWFVGAVLAFAGWVLYSAAAQSRREMILLEALQAITARDLMTREYPPITRELDLDKLFNDYVLTTGQHDYIVVEGNRLQGAVTMRNVKRVPRRRWGYTRISQVMTPAIALNIANPQQSAVSVLEQMEQSEIGLMPVLENDEVVGVIALDSLIRLAKTRMEFGK